MKEIQLNRLWLKPVQLSQVRCSDHEYDLRLPCRHLVGSLRAKQIVISVNFEELETGANNLTIVKSLEITIKLPKFN